MHGLSKKEHLSNHSCFTMPGPEIQAAGEQGLEERLEVAVDGAEREAGRGQGPHQRVPVQMRGTRTRLVEMN